MDEVVQNLGVENGLSERVEECVLRWFGYVRMAKARIHDVILLIFFPFFLISISSLIFFKRKKENFI